MLKVVGTLGRWMERRDVSPGELGSAAFVEFIDDCRYRGMRRVPSIRSLDPLLGFLRGEGVVGDLPSPSSPMEMLLADYRVWLVTDRGLSETTIIRYEKLARRFLEQHGGDGGIDVASLDGKRIVAFLIQESERLSVGGAKGRVAELRSLLKFLYLRGWTPRLLTTVVPPVAGWHDTGIPKSITATEVQSLLDHCDRTDPIGIRDYAILILVARLGLRSIEVSRLELGDIDWRGGQIVLRGKASREDGMPLPAEVGEALSAYLSQARPATPLRPVFLACNAPIRGIRPDLVGDVTRRACDRAGLARVGAHRLRHSLATEMLRRGVTLTDISQVLRHRDLATTAIYAKVDSTTLRTIALPWPEAQR
ncbi:site-specific integrase [Rhodococcus koreensis]|uniref:site-specific integrase n=1 Tax=Rhodococcus koreensis TaxID=99653 RepID=UPI00366F9C79